MMAVRRLLRRFFGSRQQRAFIYGFRPYSFR
jgi:hypothetical protein